MKQKKNIYFDNHATTQLLPEIREELADFFNNIYGNANSLEHVHGDEARNILNQTVQELSDFFSVPTKSIIFTSGATESANIVVSSTIKVNIGKSPKIILSAVEHPCIYETVTRFASAGYCDIEIINVDRKGRLDLSQLESASSDAKLGCFMAAQNEIGNIYPVNTVGKILKKNNCKFLCDATQIIGKSKIDIKQDNIDYLILSGHKIHALQGIGILINRNFLEPITPLFYGGSQQNGIRPGTYNMPGIFTLGRAISYLKNHYNENIKIYRDLQLHLLNYLRNDFNDILITGDIENKLPNNVHFCIKNTQSSEVIQSLFGKVSISSGSACSSGTIEQSKILKRMNISEDYINGAIRIGFSIFNTKEEIDFFVFELSQLIKSN